MAVMRSIPSGRGILAVQYFLYFGVMGMYLPFFNLYCYQLGFSGWQIGALSATRSIAMILFSIFWGLLADRFHARRWIYIACNFVSSALWGLFLVTADFYWMLAVTIIHGIFYAPLIAFLEAFAMEALGRDKKRYGRMRAWGSVAFILVVLALGRGIDAYGVKIIISLIFAGAWAQALVSLGFPKNIAPGERAKAGDWRQLLTPRLAVFQISGFLMLVSHGAYYTFFSIHLANLGYDTAFIGVSWAVASTAEILTMFFSERIFRRFRYESVLIFSFAVAVLRWGGLWTATSVWALLLLQLTHAMTYGTFHMASILYMDHLAPQQSKTLGQVVNNAVSYGLGLMAGFFLSGALYQAIGAHNLFAVSGGIALLGGVIFAAFSLTGKPSGTARPISPPN
jgi:PPP family 3-phenylpropionic acid transporter